MTTTRFGIRALLTASMLTVAPTFVVGCGPEPSDNGNGGNNGNGGQTSTPSYGTPQVPNTGGWQNNTPCKPGVDDKSCASGFCASASNTCENNVYPGQAKAFSATGTSSVDLTVIFYPATGGLTRAVPVSKNSCFYVTSDPSHGETAYTLKWKDGDGKRNEWDLWVANGRTFAGMSLPFSVVTVLEETHKVYEAAELAIGEAAIGGTHVAKKMDRSKLPNRVEMDAQLLGSQGSCGALGSCPCR